MELLCTNSLISDVIFREDMRAKPFEAPVIVISDIPIGLASLLGDLVEAITFEEMEFQGLPLLCREFLPERSQYPPTSDLIDRYLSFGSMQMFFIEFLSIIVLAKAQISSAIDGAVVRHLDNP